MKRISSLIAIIIPLSISSAVLAEEVVVSDVLTMPVASETESTVSHNPGAQPMHSKHGEGKKHKGKCQRGKGHSGKKHGGHGKEKHDKHADVVHRLDMIEARMAKIEAMLESLLRR